MIHKTIFFFAFFALCGVHIYAQDHNQPVEAALTSEDLAAFREQARTSVIDLNGYIKVLAEKNRGTKAKNTAIDLAVGLFSSENNIFQVSSLRGETNSFPVRVYFKRLTTLPYTSVSIVWFNVYMSSSFRQGPDGKYYGRATVSQRFEGKNNSEMGSYRDVTTKDINLVIESKIIYEGPRSKKEWVLKLADINVVETRTQ
jgi:hypothetical protein